MPGLDTSLAARLRELAGRVTTQAEDLRRRQQLVHELQRQKVSIGTSTPAGSFLEIPDGLNAAKGLLDGTLAGRAALNASRGDAKALAELEKYAPRTEDTEFVKVFLGILGAGGATRLPGSIAEQLRTASDHGDPARVSSLAAQGQRALGMLSRTLAKATDPKNPAYLGADFTKDSGEAGPDRAQVRRHEVLGLPGPGAHLACSRRGAAVLEGVHGDRRTRRDRLRAASSARTNGRRARTGWAERSAVPRFPSSTWPARSASAPC